MDKNSKETLILNSKGLEQASNALIRPTSSQTLDLGLAYTITVNLQPHVDLGSSQTPTFGGQIAQNPVISHTPIHQSISTNLNHFSLGGLPVGAGIGQAPSNSFHNQGFLSTAQNHSAYVNPLQSGTSAAPPLFVGFLTNDVSMNQIRNLFTSYTKAVNDSRDTTRASALAPKQKGAVGKRAPGRFDVNEAIGEESEDEIETPELGKRDATLKRTRETKVSDSIGKTIDIASLQAQGTKLQPALPTVVSPLPPHKKSTDEVKAASKPAGSTGLFGNGPTKPAETKPAEPETKPTASTPVLSSLFNSVTAASKKDPSATTASTGATGLFASMAPVETANSIAPKDNKPAESVPSVGGGLFGDVKEPSKRKIGEDIGDKAPTKPTPAANDPLKSFMVLNPVETAAPEKKDTAPQSSSGLFSRVDTAKPAEPTNSATTFTKQGPGSLFSSAINQVSETQQDKTDSLNTGFYGEGTSQNAAADKNPTAGSTFFSKDSATAAPGTPKPAGSSFFGGHTPQVSQQAPPNPFLGDASSHDPLASLQKIVQQSSSSPNSLFGPKGDSGNLATAPSQGLFSGGGLPGLFSGAPSGSAAAAGSIAAAPAAPEGLFSSLSGPAEASRSGLFPQAGQSSAGSLFGRTGSTGTSGLFSGAPAAGSAGITGGLFGGTSGSTGLFNR